MNKLSNAIQQICDRPHHLDVIADAVNHIGDSQIFVQGLKTGDGKTYAYGNAPHIILDEMSSKYGKEGMYMYTTPFTQPIDEFTTYALSSIEIMLKQGKNVSFYVKKKHISTINLERIDMLKWKYLNFTWTTDLEAMVGNIVMKKDTVAIVAESLSGFFDRDNFESKWKYISNYLPCFLVADEFHNSNGATCAETYKAATENPAGSYSDVRISKLLNFIKSDNVTVIGLTGTPTMEHRGIVVNGEKHYFKFKAYNVGNTEYIKDINSINIIKPRFSNRLDTIEEIQMINYAQKFAIKKKGISFVKLGNTRHEEIASLTISQFRKYIGDTDLKSILWVKESELYRLDKNLQVKILSKNVADTNYYIDKYNINTVVVCSSLNAGWNNPKVDSIFILSNSAKVLEQCGMNQVNGRGIRLCGDNKLDLFYVQRKGIEGMMVYFAEQVYGIGTSIYNEILEKTQNAMNSPKKVVDFVI